jgi:hypothetical protein
MRKWVLVFACLLLACTTPSERNVPQKMVVTHIYQHDVKANDGKVKKQWRTVLQLEDGSRVNVWGKWGQPNDTLKNMVAWYAGGCCYIKAAGVGY